VGHRSRIRLTLAAQLCLFLVAAAPVLGASGQDGSPPPPDASSPLDAALDALLARHVSADGLVDYRALGADRSTLDGYLAGLRKITIAELERMPRTEQLAMWINAYNAYTLELILDHLPIASIWDVTPWWKRAFGGPFSIYLIPLGALAPELQKPRLSLDDVEHRIVRKRFAEPRAHFALVCASRGCPPLARHAYRGDVLDAQLDDAGRRFFAQTSKNRYEPAREVLVVSPIFRWFASDFEPLGGPAGAFERYAPATDAEAVRALGHAPAIEFSDYDWSLNSRP
jgi:Protein of unknown function, DUF547